MTIEEANELKSEYMFLVGQKGFSENETITDIAILSAKESPDSPFEYLLFVIINNDRYDDFSKYSDRIPLK